MLTRQALIKTEEVSQRRQKDSKNEQPVEERFNETRNTPQSPRRKLRNREIPLAVETTSPGTNPFETSLNIVDINQPSAPESVRNEVLLDGIEPLQANKTVLNPIHLLKNKIMSEDAEVMFDPIIPLPSSTGHRYKLRPRRPRRSPKSTQDRASGPKKRKRPTRSVTASAGRAQPQTALRRSARVRNAMQSRKNQGAVKAKEKSTESNYDSKRKKNNPAETPAANSANVPPVNVGRNIEIITETSRKLLSATGELLYEARVLCQPSSSSQSPPPVDGWDIRETKLFYRALACVHTDFSLMTYLFPQRTKLELMQKYKKEKELHKDNFDSQIPGNMGWNLYSLMKNFDDERVLHDIDKRWKAEKRRKELLEEKDRNFRASMMLVKQNEAAKALQITMQPGVSNENDGVPDTVNRASPQRSETIHVPEDPPPSIVVPMIRIMVTISLLSTGELFYGPFQTSESRVVVYSMTSMVQVPTVSLNRRLNESPEIEVGDIVLLALDDPAEPGKKIVQTLIAGPHYRLNYIALPQPFVDMVVGKEREGTPQITSPPTTIPPTTIPPPIRSLE